MRASKQSARILLAGVLGGAAEAAWIILYSGTAGAAEVARQVTETVVEGAHAASTAVAAGLGIHMALSMLVALAYWLLVWKPLTGKLGLATNLVFASSALAAIWAVNFLVVLPAVNPSFVGLMPYPVTLASKLMFGIAMAAGFAWAPSGRVATHASY